MALSFEWDAAKARSNERKHSVTFEEAATVFEDPLAATIEDPDAARPEQRFVTIGRSRVQRLIVVVHVDRPGTIRIISAREATRREKRSYEEDA